MPVRAVPSPRHFGSRTASLQQACGQFRKLPSVWQISFAGQPDDPNHRTLVSRFDTDRQSTPPRTRGGSRFPANLPVPKGRHNPKLKLLNEVREGLRAVDGSRLERQAANVAAGDSGAQAGGDLSFCGKRVSCSCLTFRLRSPGRHPKNAPNADAQTLCESLANIRPSPGHGGRVLFAVGCGRAVPVS